VVENKRKEDQKTPEQRKKDGGTRPRLVSGRPETKAHAQVERDAPLWRRPTRGVEADTSARKTVKKHGSARTARKRKLTMQKSRNMWKVVRFGDSGKKKTHDDMAR
jgi:hypothetical protein